MGQQAMEGLGSKIAGLRRELQLLTLEERRLLLLASMERRAPSQIAEAKDQLSIVRQRLRDMSRNLFDLENVRESRT